MAAVVAAAAKGCVRSALPQPRRWRGGRPTDPPEPPAAAEADGCSRPSPRWPTELPELPAAAVADGPPRAPIADGAAANVFGKLEGEDDELSTSEDERRVLQEQITADELERHCINCSASQGSDGSITCGRCGARQDVEEEGEEEKDEGDEDEQESYLDRKLGRSVPAPNPHPEIQTPARPRVCCRFASPIGQVEEC